MNESLITPPFSRLKIIVYMTIAELNTLLITVLGFIGTIAGLVFGARSKRHDNEIAALKEALEVKENINEEKDKVIEFYKKELDGVLIKFNNLLLKYETLQAKNETLTAEVASLRKRINELEKN